MQKIRSGLATAAFLACSLLQGCTTPSAPTFSWFHPQGGEYLFEFDAANCKAAVKQRELALGVDPKGPFFTCMRDYGYVLVSEDRRAVPRALRNTAVSGSAAL